jgi:hypothetical protein
LEEAMMPDANRDEAAPTPPDAYQTAVEFLADRAGVPMSQVYREALDALIKAKGLDWTQVEDWARRRGKR